MLIDRAPIDVSSWSILGNKDRLLRFRCSEGGCGLHGAFPSI